jgi:hypothetical protein
MDKRWRYSPLRRIRCEQDAHEDDEAEDEDEDEDESKSEDEEGEGVREVFANGGTPCAPEMEDQEFCKPVEGKEEDDYDPEWSSDDQ